MWQPERWTGAVLAWLVPEEPLDLAQWSKTEAQGSVAVPQEQVPASARV